MFPSEDSPPTIVVVGNFGVGKSSFVRALIGDTKRDSNDQSHDSHPPKNGGHLSGSSQESEFDVAPSDLIVEARTTSIADANGYQHTVRVVDTAARDVTGTQQQMQNADLVIVLMNASSSKSIDDLNDYWIDQFADISLYSPVLAVFNQIDRVSADNIAALKQRFAVPAKEHFVLEDLVYVSAHTLEGMAECQQRSLHIIQSVREEPRWVLIDPFSWKLQPALDCALRRIFRLLDVDGDGVLNLSELGYFNEEVLREEFNAKHYNLLLRKLNEVNEQLVSPQGLRLEGFRYLLRRFAIAKKWSRCWDVLRFYHYRRDLTLHHRVFPQLPQKAADQTLELTPSVYALLERLFVQFADDTLLDDHDAKSIASSMISSNPNPMKHEYQRRTGDGNDSQNLSDDDGHRVLSVEALRSILAVLPPALRCSLSDLSVMDHFETAGRRLNKLTKNGWLSFWAMLSAENPLLCFQQLTYLDLDPDTDRNAWFRLTDRKLDDQRRHSVSRSVVRVLLFGGPKCGKTTFCDRLLCRIPSAPTTRRGVPTQHRPTTQFRAVSNRVGVSNEFNFLAITEVPALTHCVEEAMDHFVSAYDLILLMFDQSQSRSFYEMQKIFDRMPRDHMLPIQVLATKTDLTPVEQRDLEPDSDGTHSVRGTKGGDAIYSVPDALSAMGLAPYAPTYLKHDGSSDFAQLFDDLFFIATNPHFRRLKTHKVEEPLPWKTIIKRTVTITVGVSVVLLSAYKMYKWWWGRPAAAPRESAPMAVQRRYRL